MFLRGNSTVKMMIEMLLEVHVTLGMLLQEAVLLVEEALVAANTDLTTETENPFEIADLPHHPVGVTEAGEKDHLHQDHDLFP